VTSRGAAVAWTVGAAIAWALFVALGGAGQWLYSAARAFGSPLLAVWLGVSFFADLGTAAVAASLAIFCVRFLGAPRSIWIGVLVGQLAVVALVVVQEHSASPAFAVTGALVALAALLTAAAAFVGARVGSAWLQQVRRTSTST
jgi:hypothetical protein